MKTIYFVTTSKYKFREARSILKNSKINLKICPLEINEFQEKNQLKVAIHKAKEAFQKIQKPLIIDDTALYFEGFDEFPGTYTKLVSQTLGIDNLLKLIGNNLGAWFKTVIVYKDNKREVIFEGVLKGKIQKENPLKINPDRPFSSIFVPENYTKPLVYLKDGKAFSHRKIAFQKFKEWILKNESGI